MSHKFLFDSSFHLLLIAIDSELIKKVRAKGCVYCGGRLHQANYPRSPLGVPSNLREHYERRYSLCCGQCRRRTTSTSVRFFGRCWFPAPILLLISALTYGATDKKCAQLERLFGVRVSKKTWKRWRCWWALAFKSTSFWPSVSGSIPVPQLNGPFPKTFLAKYPGLLQKRLLSLLRFLAPLTAGIHQAV